MERTTALWVSHLFSLGSVVLKDEYDDQRPTLHTYTGSHVSVDPPAGQRQCRERAEGYLTGEGHPQAENIQMISRDSPATYSRANECK